MFKFNYRPGTEQAKTEENITQRAGFFFQIVENGKKKRIANHVQVGEELTIEYSPGAELAVDEKRIKFGASGRLDTRSDSASRRLMKHKDVLPKLLTELALKISPRQEHFDLISGKVIITEPVVHYQFFDQIVTVVEKKIIKPASVLFLWLGTCDHQVNGSFEGLTVIYDARDSNVACNQFIRFNRFGLIEFSDKGIADKVEPAFRDLAIKLIAADQSQGQIWTPSTVTKIELE